MSLIDHPDKWIVKMFKLNERETGGDNAAYYPEGIKSRLIKLENDELIYGHFTSKKRTYYFTSTSLIITGEQQVRIKINDVIRTNGSFRSGHKVIEVETIDERIHKINIEEFPYRTQQLFYQLIERSSALVVNPLFGGPEKLKNITSDISSNDLKALGLATEKKSVIKKIDILKNNYQIEFHGKMNGDFIFPDSQGVLILKIKNRHNEIEIFNSTTDGYNGVTDVAAGIRQDMPKEFTNLDTEIARLILKFNYTIEDHEFEDLKIELNLKSKAELGNLFGSIEIYAEKNAVISLLTSLETQ